MTRSLVAFAALAACRGNEPAAPPTPAKAPPTRPAARASTVAISGRVIDQRDGKPVPGVQVVLRDVLREHTTTSTQDGTFSLSVAPGNYRAFVRDDAMMSVAAPVRHVRLESGPRAALAGAPDEELQPELAVTEDTSGIELGVVRGGLLTGTVVDPDDNPLAHAIVRARGGALRPVLGTDVGETGADGRFELRVPPGRYALDVSHPRFATVDDPGELEIVAGGHDSMGLAMSSGCVVSGRVVGPDGRPANDGALERSDETTPLFAPAGRVEPDGTFRWTTTEVRDLALRAWPWRSAPSEAQHVACRRGARFDDVVFHIPDKRPDLDGMLVDAAGAPVPLAPLEIKPLGGDGLPQQERADAAGHWQVYDLAPGHYEITATAPGRGIVVATVTAPGDGLRLQLGGTGRIEGTTTALASGSLEVSFESCTDAVNLAHQPLPVAREPRIVLVRGGHFTIDGAPACHLAFLARWRDQQRRILTSVTAGATAEVDADLGPLREKTVHGTLRDAKDRPVSGAHVTAMRADDSEHRTMVSTRTDDEGRFTLKTVAGANVVAETGNRVANATVGLADVPEEQLELVLRTADQ